MTISKEIKRGLKGVYIFLLWEGGSLYVRLEVGVEFIVRVVFMFVQILFLCILYVVIF